MAGLAGIGPYKHTWRKTYNWCKNRVMARFGAPPPPPPAGLREAKKARTRQAISDVATALFVERGFEAVTVAEIAAAADVSVKTVFNYFPAKEDLFFDRAAELERALAAAITERAPGVTVSASLRELFAANRAPFPGLGWRDLRDPRRYEQVRAFLLTEERSPSLRARRLVLSHDWARELAPLVAREFGLRPDASAARAYAAMLMAIASLRARELSAAMLERRSPAVVERRVRAVVAEGFGRLELAFADVDRA